MAFLLVLFASVFIQIVMRNLFNSGSIQLEEIARFSLVSLVFLMAPVLVIEKQHIIVDVVLIFLKGPVRRIFDAVIQIACCAYSVYILVAIVKIMQRNWNVKTPAMGMPNIVFYIPIGLGIAFMVVGTAWQAAQALGTTSKGVST